MPLFEIVLLQTPDDKGRGEKLLHGPIAIIAKNEQAAAIAAVMENRPDEDIDINRLDVIVRPFE